MASLGSIVSSTANVRKNGTLLSFIGGKLEMEGVKSFSAAYFDDEESVREWATGLYSSQLSGHSELSEV